MVATLASARPDDSGALVRHVVECVSAGVPRTALWVPPIDGPGAAPARARRALADALNPLLAMDRARLFALPDGHRVAIWRGAGPALPTTGLSQPDTDGRTARLFRLPPDAAALIARVRALTDRGAPPVAQAAPPLDAAALARLEAALARADVARFARRGAVCVLRPAGGFALAWEHRRLSLREIGEVLAPDRDLAADPWLLLRLRLTLERRLLALLAAADELSGARPFMLDVLSASVVSPAFARFDAALTVGLRGRVTLAFTLADVLADPVAFRFARDYARARAYRILLRAGRLDALPALEFTRLAADLIHARWHPGAAALPSGLAPSAVVLDTDAAAGIAWGAARGITLFEGRAVRPGAALLEASGGAQPAATKRSSQWIV